MPPPACCRPLKPDGGHQVTVIISTFQQGQQLRQLLDCLAVQVQADPFNVIVCDDGSDAHHRSVGMAATASAPFRAVYIWQPDDGYRLAASRNNGIRQAPSGVLLFLDADMLVAPTLVAFHQTAHRQAQGRLIVPGISVDAHLDEAQIEGRTGVSALSLCSRYTDSKRTLLQEALLLTEAPWSGVWGGHCSVTNGDDVLFDERMVGFGHEDQELFFRLASLGFTVASPARHLAYHVASTGNVKPWNPWSTSTPEAIESQILNCLYLLDKFGAEYPVWGAWPLRYFVFSERAGQWRRAAPEEVQPVAEAIVQARRWREHVQGVGRSAAI